MTRYKTLVTLACWLCFLGGLVCIGVGTYYRFTFFYEFKLWQGAMSSGMVMLLLTGVIAYFRHRIE